MAPGSTDPTERAADRAKSADQRGQADDLPPVHVPTGSASGWRWSGFALIVCGLAGLLFHLNEEVPVLQSRLGQVSIGLIVFGLVLIVAGAFVRPRAGGPPPGAGS